ncbi:addiction module toxin, HicA family [Brachyspira aalborgi]|uniref:Addiction module toxin, HicA family n=1 Tax=Brachyspira aalborgi TaxID=29522 RepID=A0A5C8G919_9SPIR|nr:type II toxin-antitoxin system HicA family toxin [Brachyspira aalborgi]TXJ58492.1 addiction module toxin, HicA family [Brachyspira aalborgi]
MTAKEIIKIIEKDGWYRVRSKSGHLQFKHPVKKGKVTVPFHGNHDLRKKVVKSILKQAQINLGQL